MQICSPWHRLKGEKATEDENGKKVSDIFKNGFFQKITRCRKLSFPSFKKNFCPVLDLVKFFFQLSQDRNNFALCVIIDHHSSLGLLEKPKVNGHIYDTSW